MVCVRVLAYAIHLTQEVNIVFLLEIIKDSIIYPNIARKNIRWIFLEL